MGVSRALGLQAALAQPPVGGGSRRREGPDGWTRSHSTPRLPGDANSAGWLGRCKHVGLLPCSVRHHSFQTPHCVPRGCAACKTQRKAGQRPKPEGHLPGLQVAQPSPSPAAAPGPEPERPVESAEWPRVPSERGPGTACPFCQNVCLQTPTCTVLCQASAQTSSQRGSREPALKGTSPHLPSDPSGSISRHVA